MKKVFVTLVALIMVLAQFRAEQVVSLDGHFAVKDVGAFSFPGCVSSSGKPCGSSAVRVVNSSVPVDGPFHVICMNLGSQRVRGAQSGEIFDLACVSTLAARGLYVHGELGESCFARASADPRFVIGTPVLNDDTCVLNVVIDENPDMLDELYNPEEKSAKRASMWSVDAQRTKPRVDAYEQVVRAMKRNHVDFTKQILHNDDVPVPFRDFRDMIMMDVANRAVDLEQISDSLNSAFDEFVENPSRFFEKHERFLRSFNAGIHEAAMRFDECMMPVRVFARQIQGLIDRTFHSITNACTLGGVIPPQAFMNPAFLIFMVFVVYVAVQTMRTVLFFAKPLCLCMAGFYIFMYWRQILPAN